MKEEMFSGVGPPTKQRSAPTRETGAANRMISGFNKSETALPHDEDQSQRQSNTVNSREKQSADFRTGRRADK